MQRKHWHCTAGHINELKLDQNPNPYKVSPCQ